MPSKFIAGSAGRRAAYCATYALLASSVIAPAAFFTVTFVSSTPALAQSSTPLPTIPVETKKKKKVHTPRAEPSRGVRQEVDVQPEADAEPAPRTREPGSIVNSGPGVSNVSASEASARSVSTSDTASVFGNVPGVSVYTNGGVSGLPTIHGFADDRLRIKVDGMDTIASCPNHMNSPLSYIDPSQIGSAQVWTGVTPVSIGGDSIGGAIIVNSREPLFAAPGQGLITKGSVGAFYRSNGDGFGGDLAATAATEHFSLSYAGAYTKSDNYFAGGDFVKFPLSSTITKVLPRDEVGSTAFEAQNHLATLAYKNNNQLIELKANYQYIPKELYPNQRMDMLSNEQIGLNLHYSGQFNWGKVDTRTYWQHVDHFMDFGEDKLYYYGDVTGNDKVTKYPTYGMPMYTRTDTFGNSSKVDFNVTSLDVLRAGYDLQFFRLDDWWTPAPDCGFGNCVGGMAPLTFWNINGGERDRYSPFLEWEHKWSPTVTSLLGARYERIETDTGPVHGYYTMTTPGVESFTFNKYARTVTYDISPVGTRDAFNAMDRSRSFDNVDLSALVRYTPNANIDMNLGLSRTARVPSLYELYPWSRNSMALEMNNFVGDGNGYLGNPFLKPEIANKISADFDWHSRNREAAIRFSPYYSYVENYIDAVQWNMAAANPVTSDTGGSAVTTLATDRFVQLKYMNEDARLYGFDLSAKAPIAKTSYGDFSVAGMLSYTNGRDISLDTGLYNIMPFNGKLALIHKLGGWQGVAEVVGVSGKDDVSDQRNEMKTPGYGLLNLRGSYTWSNIHLNFGVENVLDQLYYHPLGGAYLGEGVTMSFNREVRNNDLSSWGTSVAGAGRTFYVGMKIDF